MPIPSCPPEISEMMTLTVFWESFLGFDGHAEPIYAPGIDLDCWRESHGLMQGGIEALRVADHTTADPDWDLFFSGDDPNARKIKLYDRLTIGGVADDVGLTLQPSSVNTISGPPFDNQNPWLIVVAT